MDVLIFRKALSMPRTMSRVGQISLSLQQSAKSGLIQTRGSILPSLPIWSHHVASCMNQSLLKVRNFGSQRWTVQNRRRSWSNNPLFDGDNLIYALIGTNVAIFGLWTYSKQNYYWTGFMRRHFMVSSNGVIKDYRLHTLLTSSFSHNDPWHLLGNMITVYFFGRNVLSQIGGPRFAALYLGGGLVSTVSQVVWPYCIPRDFPATYKISKWSQALGASGSVAAVVTWAILKAPMQPILLYLVLPIPACVLGAAYLFFELSNFFNGSAGEGQGSHLGGVAFGGLFFAFKK